MKYTIKQLEWSRFYWEDDMVTDTARVADFGKFVLEYESDKAFPKINLFFVPDMPARFISITLINVPSECMTIEQARQVAQRHFEKNVIQYLNPE